MSDLISRADAIEAIQNAYCKPCKERGDDHNEVMCRACDFDDAIIQIDALPSADADAYTRITGLMPDAEQTDCTEFIEWLTDIVVDEEMWELNAVAYGEIICRKLDKLGVLEVTEEPSYYIRPSANVVQGEWEHWGSPFSDESEVIDTIVCSVCGARFIEPKDEPKGEYNFCPSCGARMENKE